MKTLSIRQPWAWLIVNGHKDIENRSWYCRYRGKLLIHAAKSLVDYDDAAISFISGINKNIIIPDRKTIEVGGIVGSVVMVDCVRGSKSPWFVGEYGFVLKKPEAVPFLPCKGALGLFDFEVNGQAIAQEFFEA